MKNKIAQFQSDIRKRRAFHRRDLPRRNTQDPYAIRISETMLCQTQVSRVIVYYKQWLKLFPSYEILAQATPSQVLKAWSGLGYNSRGLRVLEAAKLISQLQSFPDSYEKLLTLPGVGDYVASAVLAFAFNQDVAVVDTNIRRILIHHFDLQEDISLKELKNLASEVLPQGYARDWYNALMDYGALELTSKKTGIRPLTRQSKFEGSRRQVRAWIVKEIVHSTIGHITLGSIEQRFSHRDDVHNIIEDMIKENIISNTNGVISIKEQ